MDRLVMLQTRVLTRNAQNEEVESYTDLVQVWAEKIDLRGREWFSAQQMHADVTTRWRIHHRDDITVLHRLTHDGRAYDINHVAEIGREGGLELITTVQVP